MNIRAVTHSALTPGDWAIINRSPIFRSMDGTLSRSLFSRRMVRHYGRDELVFKQGDMATSFFLVLGGWIKLYREMSDGREVVVALFTAGESFAEAMMFRGGRYPVTAETVSPVRLLHIDGQVLRDAIVENPQISFEMLAATALHLRQLIEQVEQLKALSAPKRIASFLLSLTNTPSGAVHIMLPYEKLLIANRLGMKPESFSRALMKLRSVGVTVDRGFVHILDVARLGAYVGNDHYTAVTCPPKHAPTQFNYRSVGCIAGSVHARCGMPTSQISKSNRISKSTR